MGAWDGEVAGVISGKYRLPQTTRESFPTLEGLHWVIHEHLVA